MQRLRDKGKDLRSSFMSHFLACDDKSCTRLNDLLDRIFFEGKARHVKKFMTLRGEERSERNPLFSYGIEKVNLRNYLPYYLYIK